jgi:hypothetical protein
LGSPSTFAPTVGIDPGESRLAVPPVGYDLRSEPLIVHSRDRSEYLYHYNYNREAVQRIGATEATQRFPSPPAVQLLPPRG